MKAFTLILASLLVLGMTGSSWANAVPNSGLIFSTNTANIAVPSHPASASVSASIKIANYNYGPGLVYLSLAVIAIIAMVFFWIAVSLLKHLLKHLSFVNKTLAKKRKSLAGGMEITDAWVPTFH